MKNFLILLFRYINHYKVRGILLFVHLKILKSEHFFFKNYGSINLRKNTSDYDIFNQVYLDLEYDIELGYQPQFIVDAGANIGLTSLFYSHKYPSAKILSLEPEEDNFKMLKINTDKNKNVAILKKALWNTSESIFLNHNTSNDSHQVSNKGEETNKIDTVTIDDIISLYSIDRIDILKIDVEGAEKEIFSSNFDKWLPKVNCLVIEQHDRIKEGCSNSLFKAVNNFPFSLSMRGELLIFKFIHS